MKRILIVIDYQNDFVSGSLGFPKAAELEERIVKKIREYQENGDEVVFTLDTHEENYLQTQEGKNLPVPHCIRNTEEWNLFGKVAGLCNETTKCFEKNTFGSLKLTEYLSENRYDRVELAGIVSNICVISNAILAKAVLPEAMITVDASCIASNDDSLNQKALDVMEGMQIQILNHA